MKRKIEIGLLITAVVIVIAAIILTGGSGKKWENSSNLTGEAITIRNMTDGIMHYRISPTNSYEEPQKKVLKVGEIHRYPGRVGMDIRFDRIDGEATRRLISGQPYSFRYDGKNLVQIYEGSHGREDAVDLAPFVTTPMVVVKKMLEMAKVDATDILYDIGCGDGRIVITAAQMYGARGVGIDIDPQRIRESRESARSAGVGKLVEFRLGDATKMDISEATVVTLYLLPKSNELLRPQMEKQLKPGVYVVSHNYTIPGWEKKEIDSASVNDETAEGHTIFLYRR